MLEIENVSIRAIANRSAASAEAVANEFALSGVAVSGTVSFSKHVAVAAALVLPPQSFTSGVWGLAASD